MAYAFLSQAIKETARIIAEEAWALKELKGTHEKAFLIILDLVFIACITPQPLHQR